MRKINYTAFVLDVIIVGVSVFFIHQRNSKWWMIIAVLLMPKTGPYIVEGQ